MSSAPAVAPATTAPAPAPAPVPVPVPVPAGAGTYWCHECDMSITVSSPSLHCPHCRSLFLEELHHPPLHLSDSSSDSTSDDDEDSNADQQPPQNPNPNPNANPSPSPNPSPNPTAYLQLLVHHLAGGDSLSPSDLPLPRPHGRPSPAHKSSIDSIPTVQISDPSLLCAICKDEFFIGSSARRLPCSHVYHSDCIVPWLSSHNSCPLCRFRLPNPDGDAAATEGEGRRLAGSMVFGGRIVRGIARGQRMVFLERRVREGAGSGEQEGVTATQMAEVEGNAGPTNSGETVSSEWGGDSAAAVSGVREGMEE